MTEAPSDPAQTILWPGVHKTGTTYLQACLEASREGLERIGIDYVEREAFREAHTRPLLDTPGRAPAPTAVAGGAPSGGRRVIFDENILGIAQESCTPRGLYPEGPWRAQEMAERLGLGSPHLVLGLRNLGSYLPSLYCETLKAVPFLPFESFLQSPLPRLSWLPLVKGLQQAFPDAPLTVYTAETLRGREAALISRVIGLSATQFRKVGHSERPGFSREAVQAMRVAWEAGRPWPHERWREMVAAHPRSASPGFDPWSPEERDFFDRRYESDLAAIGALPGVELLGAAELEG